MVVRTNDVAQFMCRELALPEILLFIHKLITEKRRSEKSTMYVMLISKALIFSLCFLSHLILQRAIV